MSTNLFSFCHVVSFPMRIHVSTEIMISSRKPKYRITIWGKAASRRKSSRIVDLMSFNAIYQQKFLLIYISFLSFAYLPFGAAALLRMRQQHPLLGHLVSSKQDCVHDAATIIIMIIISRSLI